MKNNFQDDVVEIFQSSWIHLSNKESKKSEIIVQTILLMSYNRQMIICEHHLFVHEED